MYHTLWYHLFNVFTIIIRDIVVLCEVVLNILGQWKFMQVFKNFLQQVSFVNVSSKRTRPNIQSKGGCSPAAFAARAFCIIKKRLLNDLNTSTDMLMLTLATCLMRKRNDIQIKNDYPNCRPLCCRGRPWLNWPTFVMFMDILCLFTFKSIKKKKVKK